MNNGASGAVPDANGTVRKVPVGGGTPTTLAWGEVSPAGLAVDASRVYYGITGTVMKVPIDGGTPVVPFWPAYPHDAFYGSWPPASVPILVLQGGADPKTPYGDVVKPHYAGPNQYYVELPGASHIVTINEDSPMVDPGAYGCGWQVALSLLSDPTRPWSSSRSRCSRSAVLRPMGASARAILPDTRLGCAQHLAEEPMRLLGDQRDRGSSRAAKESAVPAPVAGRTVAQQRSEQAAPPAARRTNHEQHQRAHGEPGHESTIGIRHAGTSPCLAHLRRRCA